MNGLYRKSIKNNATHYLYPAGPRSKYVLPVDIIIARKGIRACLLNMRTRLKLELVDIFFRLIGKRVFLIESEGLKRLINGSGIKSDYSMCIKGTPGPYTKDTFLFLVKNGELAGVMKVASNEEARKLIKKEVENLSFIGNLPNVKKQTPILINSGTVSNEYEYVVQSPLSGSVLMAANDFKYVETFLIRLAQDTKKLSFFLKSNMWQKLESNYIALDGLITNKWQERIMNSMMLLSECLEESEFELVMSHRDFVPWNMSIAGNTIKVFDWEYAESGYLPLNDYFHYNLMPLALKKKMSISNIMHVFDKANSSEFHLETKNISFQLLAYFIDLSMLYLVSNRGRSGQDRVIGEYGAMIDKFDLWREK